MALAAGLAARVELTVSAADTALAFGSGDVPVLATPRVVALLEAATVAATDGQLAPETTTVGTRVVLDHLAATAVGRHVVAVANLTTVEGRRLVFEVALHDGDTLAAQGQVERIVVDRDRFLGKLAG